MQTRTTIQRMRQRLLIALLALVAATAVSYPYLTTGLEDAQAQQPQAIAGDPEWGGTGGG